MPPEQRAIREGRPGASPRQRQIAEAVRGLGSVEGAAADLGIARVTVQAALAHYHVAVCDERIEELETEVARLRDLDLEGQKIRRLDGLVGRLEQSLGPVSHRRLTDGAEPVNRDETHRSRNH